MATDATIADTEAKVAALKLRLPSLEGKANKKERSQVNKDIYALENDEAYLAAVKSKLSSARAEAAMADDAVHAANLRAQEQAAEKLRHKVGDGSSETDTERTLRIYWRSQVEGLFDDYAPTFEQSLVKTLGYDVPAKLEAALVRDHADGNGHVSRTLFVDLGCGTGLAAAQLRSRCHGRVVGCDLSSRMVREARKKVPR